MATAEELRHRYITNTALPYVPDSSPTTKTPVFVAGSNVWTREEGYFERRPGFPTYTTNTFTGSVVRFFAWQRWNSDFYVMLNETVSTTTSTVYKLKVGTDTTFSAIHSDSTSAEPFDFVVSNNFVYFGNGVDMKKYDGTTTSNWGITAPAAAVTVTTTTGSLTTTRGYQWVICWENSSTGHVSSPSPVSTLTTLTAQNAILTGNTTTDSQVDKTRIFRTLDGGSIFFQVAQINYSTWTASGYTDSTTDTTLATAATIAPLQNQNNRPTASKGPVWFANRIWTFDDDTLYYSNYEENVLGVEEESFASTNQRSFGTEIFGLKVAGEYLLIFTASTIYRIYGDSLATFRMDTLGKKAGCRNRACVAESGGIVGWLDSTNIVRISDGVSITEVSKPIRSDIASIVHASAAVAFFDDGTRHWLMLMDGGAGKIYVYDLDTDQWMPPWVVANITGMASGEIAAGTQRLFLGTTSKALFLHTTSYLDNGVPFTASVTTSLFDLIDTDNPSEAGVIDHLEVERNTAAILSVKYLTDDDPATSSFTTFAGSAISPPRRTQGTNLVEVWYPQNGPNARRAAIQLNWTDANLNFKVYGIAVACRGE